MCVAVLQERALRLSDRGSQPGGQQLADDECQLGGGGEGSCVHLFVSAFSLAPARGMLAASRLDGCGAVGSSAARRRKLRRLRCPLESRTVDGAHGSATRHRLICKWREHNDMTVSKVMEQVVDVLVWQEDEHFPECMEEQMADVPSMKLKSASSTFPCRS